MCPLTKNCGARAAQSVAQLPVKLRRATPISIEDTLLIVRRAGRILLRQREPGAARMAGFWDLPTPANLPHARVQRRLGEIRHTITHHHYRFVVASASARAPSIGYRWFRAEEMDGVPLSTTARKALSAIGFLACRGAKP